MHGNRHRLTILAFIFSARVEIRISVLCPFVYEQNRSYKFKKALEFCAVFLGPIRKIVENYCCTYRQNSMYQVGSCAIIVQFLLECFGIATIWLRIRFLANLSKARNIWECYKEFCEPDLSFITVDETIMRAKLINRTQQNTKGGMLLRTSTRRAFYQSSTCSFMETCCLTP